MSNDNGNNYWNWARNTAIGTTMLSPALAGITLPVAAGSHYMGSRDNPYSQRRHERELQDQFDRGVNAYRGGDDRGAQQMLDSTTRAGEFGVTLDTRGVDMDSINRRFGSQFGGNQSGNYQSGNNSSRNNQNLAMQVSGQQQANDLLDQHMNNLNLMANQQSSLANNNTGVVEMGLRNEEEARGRRDMAFNTQMMMQGQRFMADLEHYQAMRARPLNRDVSHQENDAELARISAQNRGNNANQLIAMYGQMATNRAGMYRA